MGRAIVWKNRGQYPQGICDSRPERALVMIDYSYKNNAQSQFLLMLGLAAAVTCLQFFWQGRQGFELWDEGYLWYGAQRVLGGEVPLRDFMAYDPDRYYWSAALMGTWGDSGIVALRIAAAIFQALGLACGLWAVGREAERSNWPLLVLLAVTLLVWMYPTFKVYDVVPSIVLVWAFAALVRQPGGRQHFLAGVAVGLAAVFGRNHGAYGVAGGLMVLAYLALGRTKGPGILRGLLTAVAGVAVGYSPMLAMMATVPGFGAAVVDSIRFLFQLRATNLALAVPWPWTVQFGTLPPWEALRGVILGAFFIAVALFGVIGIVACFLRRWRGQPLSPLLVAASAMALPYAHYAFSRADIVHLAQGIFPLLLGSFAFAVGCRALAQWTLAVVLCAASLILMLPVQPGWQCYVSPSCVDASVGKDRMKIEQGAVNDLAMLDNLATQYAPGAQPFIATPFWPGAYAALHRKSPMWEIYALFPRGAAFEQVEIGRIKAADPGFALIIDIAIDGNDASRFRNTHPLVYQYIVANFEPMGAYMGNSSYQIFRRRQAGK